MDLIILYTVSIIPCIIGIMYAVMSNGKIGRYTRGELEYVSGLGAWYANNINSFRRIGVFFLVLFTSPHILSLLLAYLFFPELVTITLGVVYPGILFSTLGAFAITYNQKQLSK
ncbi:MAG: hypothetical protein P1Q69_12295 [Candidatus Thorarchaeota archaeon]|nr:hypothetical protein [Candidatus Thorarchaeota archaeon]